MRFYWSVFSRIRTESGKRKSCILTYSILCSDYAASRVINTANFWCYQTKYKDLSSLINKLENDSLLAIERFESNQEVLTNHLISEQKHENIWQGSAKRKSGKVGSKITRCRNSSLNFELYVSSLCKKARKKLSELARFEGWRLTRFVCIKSKTNINDNVDRITVQLLTFGRDVSW